MHQGNWTCSGCNAAITELPFEPRSTTGLLCKDCHSKKRDAGGEPKRAEGDRPKFEGNWTCSSCGGAITSLPFQPRDASNLKCGECFKKSRAG